jgi:nifR3 family TIM-barrel protein
MGEFKEFSIGGVPIKGPVILGPMAGVTSLAYRNFMKPFGVALSYSEMISDYGIVYGNKETYEYCETSKIDHPVGLQLFGNDASITSKAIAILEKGYDYDILDINLGCPVYKVVKTGAGSAWLREPAKLYDYMKAVVEASHKPVTAKIRLGWDESSINFIEVCDVLEKAGVKAVTIHSRTTKQSYSGNARHELLKGLGGRLSIPLFISGDINDPIKAKEWFDMTGASGIMVARGGLGNPWLICAINAQITHGLLPEHFSLMHQVDYAEAFSKALISSKGERSAIMQLRGLLPHFFAGFAGSKRISIEISQTMNSIDDLDKIIDGIRHREHL